MSTFEIAGIAVVGVIVLAEYLYRRFRVLPDIVDAEFAGTPGSEQ